MATILLESTDKIIKSTELCKTLTKLLYGTHNLEMALTQFNAVCSGTIVGIDDMMLEFDAHVGDCGCHLRAQMLLSLTGYYSDPTRRQWIDSVIEVLRNINQKIIALYRGIRRLSGDLRLLGFSSSISLVDLFDRIDCTSLFAILDGHSSEMDANNAFTVFYSSNADEKSSGGGHLAPGCRHRLVKADQWNLSNYRMVARFLSYCRLLSSNKTAILDTDTKSIRYRLDPLLAFSETKTQLDRFNLISDDDQPARKALIKEVEHMQVYITQLTCDWMIKLSYELGLGQSIQK